MSGFLYFVEDPASDAVKIGWTVNSVRRRLSQLQTGNPNPLNLLGIIKGPKKLEDEWQDKFSASFIRGDWFNDSKELRAAISARRAPSDLQHFTVQKTPLRAWRDKKGLRQDEAAKLLGFTQGHYSNMEIGRVRIAEKRVRGISKLTGIPLYKLREDIYPAPASVS